MFRLLRLRYSHGEAVLCRVGLLIFVFLCLVFSFVAFCFGNGDENENTGKQRGEQ
jgi:hypothetical protein